MRRTKWELAWYHISKLGALIASGIKLKCQLCAVGGHKDTASGQHWPHCRDEKPIRRSSGFTLFTLTDPHMCYTDHTIFLLFRSFFLPAISFHFSLFNKARNTQNNQATLQKCNGSKKRKAPTLPTRGVEIDPVYHTRNRFYKTLSK